MYTVCIACIHSYIVFITNCNKEKHILRYNPIHTIYIAPLIIYIHYTNLHIHYTTLHYTHIYFTLYTNLTHL